MTLGEGDRDRLSEITGGDFDTVFDTTGNPKAIDCKFSLVSIVASDITFNDTEFHKCDTTLLSSRNATLGDFKRALQAQRNGKGAVGADHPPHGTCRRSIKIAELTDPKARVIEGMVEIA